MSVHVEDFGGRRPSDGIEADARMVKGGVLGFTMTERKSLGQWRHSFLIYLNKCQQ
jgi:hypothetical protein